MTPFPQFDSEGDGRGALRAPARDLAGGKGPPRRGACRSLTQIAQVREEIVYPVCVGKAPAILLDAFVIEEDLIRILVAEIIQSKPSVLLYDGLIQALKDAVRRRRSEARTGRAVELIIGGAGSGDDGPGYR